MIQHQNDNNNGATDGPVTVVVTRKAKKGKIRAFEEWMDGITHEAMKFEGHMGVNIIRPSAISNPEYVIIFRFNTYENLARWENSEIRNEWLKKSKDVTEGEPRVKSNLASNSGSLPVRAPQLAVMVKMHQQPRCHRRVTKWRWS